MNNKIILELDPKEAEVLKKMIQSHTPDIDDEMLAIMIYNRLLKKIEEAK